MELPAAQRDASRLSHSIEYILHIRSRAQTLSDISCYWPTKYSLHTHLKIFLSCVSPIFLTNSKLNRSHACWMLIILASPTSKPPQNPSSPYPLPSRSVVIGVRLFLLVFQFMTFEINPYHVLFQFPFSHGVLSQCNKHDIPFFHLKSDCHRCPKPSSTRRGENKTCGRLRGWFQVNMNRTINFLLSGCTVHNRSKAKAATESISL